MRSAFPNITAVQKNFQKILELLNKLERQGIIGAYDKRTLIEVSDDVVKAIAQKYENVQKGIGEIMRGPLIKTEARTILNKGISLGISQGISQGISETRKKTALKMLQRGRLTIDEIAEYSGLNVTEVTQLAKSQKE